MLASARLTWDSRPSTEPLVCSMIAPAISPTSASAGQVAGGVKPGNQVAVAPVLGIADGDKLLPPEEEKGAASAEDKK